MADFGSVVAKAVSREQFLRILIDRCHNKCSAVAEMGDRLATRDMGQKEQVLCPFGWSWVPI